MKQLRNFSTFLETVPFGVAIFVMLLFQKTSPILSGGEEQYLAFAKQAMNPEWIKNSISLTEEPGSRLVFQWIVGTGLKFMSFETFTVVARLLNYLLFAFALHSLFNKLKLPKLWTLVAFQVYILGKQSFFGGEWIFESFEPKTLAYAFLFFALNALLDRKVFLSALLLAAGTYFHFLVTGWFAIILGVYWLYQKEFKTLIRFNAWFLILISPFAIYLFETVIKNSSHFINGLNLNWSYCYGRLYHHLGIGISWDYFLSKQLHGVVIAAFVCFFLVRFKDKFKELEFFRAFIIIVISLSLFFAVYALYDSFVLDQYAGFLLKTYPFRPMALAQFFSFLLVAFYLNKKMQHKNVALFLTLTLVVLFISQTVKNIDNSYKSIKKTVSFNEMARYIQANTPKTAVFHFVQMPHYISETFIRSTEREAVYIYKFIPAESEKLYDRILLEGLLGIMETERKIPTELIEKYHLQYLVSNGTYSLDQLKLVKKLNEYYLYKIE